MQLKDRDGDISVKLLSGYKSQEEAQEALNKFLETFQTEKVITAIGSEQNGDYSVMVFYR